MNKVVDAAPDPRPLVLLVEDDADTREMYLVALEFDGFRVIETSSAADALNTAIEIQPDIVVTDIGLRGGIDGMGIAAGLKRNALTARVPVLAVTGREAASLGESASLFDDVLVKPVLPERLSSQIRVVLERSRALVDRSVRVRPRVPQLISPVKRASGRAQTVFERRARGALRRPCPVCGTLLDWRERRKSAPATIDRYDPCARGCGEFVYDYRTKRMTRVPKG